MVFGYDEGDKEGAFVDNDCASAAKSLDDGDFFALDGWDIEEGFGLARNSHDDGAGRSLIDDAKAPIICSEKRFF